MLYEVYLVLSIAFLAYSRVARRLDVKIYALLLALALGMASLASAFAEPTAASYDAAAGEWRVLRDEAIAIVRLAVSFVLLAVGAWFLVEEFTVYLIDKVGGL